MADLSSTRVFGKLTVMHDAILKANAEIIGDVTANSFAGNGALLTDLNASNLTTGTVANARLPTTATRWPSFSEVTGKPSAYPASSHAHPVAEIIGLSDAATTTVASIRSGTTKSNVGLGNVDNVSAVNLRARATHTGTQTLATISDAGSAASRDVTSSSEDITSGRVLKVGDFGVGTHIGTLNDLFDSNFNSFNKFSGEGTVSRTWYNGPLGNNTVHTGILKQSVRSFNNAIHQIYISALGETPEIYHRVGSPNSSMWYPWQRTYDTGNIVGNVSQSGGVANGAIIERGSNSNGVYVKFADGTLICASREVKKVSDYAGVAYDLGDKNFPHSYADTPVVNTTASVASINSKFFGAYSLTARGILGGWSSVHLRNFNSSQINSTDVQSLFMSFSAIGRWY